MCFEEIQEDEITMLTAEISNKLKILETTVSEFKELVDKIDCEFPHPKLVRHGDRYVFRHKPQERSDTLASYLKLVRIISLLKACLHLIHKGHMQEVYVLCRAIDEAEDDITFFALPLGETGTHERQMRLLKEFYQEEHDDPNDPLSNSKRDRVPRKSIWAASARIPNDAAAPDSFLKNMKSIYSTFSGYVHGTYVTIMEMYHPSKQKYQMYGMLNSSRIFECIDNLPNHICRALSALESLSHRIKRLDIAKSALELNCNLAEKTDCMHAEGIARMKRRLDPDFLRKAN
jgi:hypothetical protein